MSLAYENLLQDLAQIRQERDEARAESKRLREVIQAEIDGCYCDDVDGNCNELRPPCVRCVALAAALGKHGVVRVK